MNSSATYRCGDVVYGSSSGTGHVQSGNRYYVIVSNNVGNQHSPVYSAIPFTRKLKKIEQETHAVFEAGTGGLPARSMLLAEQTIILNKDDVQFKAGTMAEADLDKVAIAMVFSMPIVARAFKNGIEQSAAFQKVADA